MSRSSSISVTMRPMLFCPREQVVLVCGGSGVRKGHLAARLFVRGKRMMLSYCFKTMVSEEPIMTSLSVHHQTEGKRKLAQLEGDSRHVCRTHLTRYLSYR